MKVTSLQPLLFTFGPVAGTPSAHLVLLGCKSCPVFFVVLMSQLLINPYNPDVANHYFRPAKRITLTKTSQPNPLDYEAKNSQNLDPNSYSYSTSLHTFTVTFSWVFSYFKVYEIWIPTNHMGLKGLSWQLYTVILSPCCDCLAQRPPPRPAVVGPPSTSGAGERGSLSALTVGSFQGLHRWVHVP